jgi:hypothetical protein
MDISNPEVKTASLKLLSLTRRKLTFHWKWLAQNLPNCSLTLADG